jgi:KDO2-lipid IV(A) lauroyltransferase
MNLQEIFKNDKAIKAGMWVARLTPRWAGYGLAKNVGSRVAKNQSGVYRQLRENISHIPGADDEPGKLHNLTKRALINAGKNYYDFYHVIGDPPATITNYVNIPDRLRNEIDKIQASGRGVQLAGIHLSNFDLGSICLSAVGLEIQGLSAANPNQGYQFQNELRKKYGFMTTPIDPKTLREAIRNLKNGKIVATGLDWPQHDETELTKVFGKPAYVPLATARLAMMTNAVTIIIAFYKDSRPKYQMHMSEPMDVIRTGNKQEEIRLNTSQYMKYFEKFVSQHPDQWMMFHKFWADSQD